MITVYIWESTIYKGTWGHCSMRVDKPDNVAIGWPWPLGRYFSWWPDTTPTNPFSSVKRMRPESYEKDMELEKAKEDDPPKKADSIYTFLDGALDEKVINEFIDELVRGSGSTSSWTPTKEKGASVYNFVTQNCSATVAHALRAGVTASKVNVSWPNYFVWYPNRVNNYCISLAAAIPERLVKINGVGMEGMLDW